MIHAASAIPKDRAAPVEAWKTNDRMRREGTRNLLAGAERHRATLVLQSVTMIYGPAGDTWIDASNAQIAPAKNLISMVDAERLALASPVRSLILRQGLLFGADAGASAALLAAVRSRSLPIVIDRDCWQPLLHPDDFAETVCEALQTELTGTYDVVSDLATTSQLISIAAALIGANQPPELPLDQIERTLDPGVVSAWYSSRRVSGQGLAQKGIVPTVNWTMMLSEAHAQG